MTLAALIWHNLNWQSATQSVGPEFIAKKAGSLTLSSEVYCMVTLTVQSSAIIVNVTQIPVFAVPKGFTLSGSLETSIQLPFSQDDVLIPL